MTTPAAAPIASFAELGLPEELLAHLASRKMTVPTPVQAAIIPLALAGITGAGGDLLAQARTGSGKTLAYLLPLAVAVRVHGCKRAWVVCPTRELAQQVAREAILVLGANSVATLIGGNPWGQQARELSSKPALVVGTPGRMRDHLDRGTLKSDAEILVLDEADQMLDMGFKEELDALVKDLGESVARWLFSATFPPAVANAVQRWLDKPREVRLDVKEASSHVPQKFVVAPRGGELTALVRLLQVLEPARALVFTRTRLAVEETVQAMALQSIEAAGISGDLQQDARERVLARFRSGKLPVLVATDVAARGLDVQGVTHVFNLGLPVGAASYSHRVGRTARAGAEGEAWTVIAPGDRSRFVRMTAIAGSRPTAATMPTAADIVSSRRKRLATRVEESLGEGLTLPQEFAALIPTHGAEALLAALLHRLVPDAPVEKERAIAAPHERTNGPTDTLFLSLGEVDGATPAIVVATLCRSANISSSQLGRMRIFPRHTLIGVSSAVREQVLSADIHYRGRRVNIRPDAAGGGRADAPPSRPPAVAPFGARPYAVAPAAAASSTPSGAVPSATPHAHAPRTSAPPARSHAPAAAVVPPAHKAAPAASAQAETYADTLSNELPAGLTDRPAAPAHAPAPAARAAGARPAAPARTEVHRPASPVRAHAPAPAPAKALTSETADEDGDDEPGAGARLTPGDGVATLRIQLGRDSGISVRTLRKFICKAGKISKGLIGDIVMTIDATDVAVPRDVAIAIARQGTLEVKEHHAAVHLLD